MILGPQGNEKKKDLQKVNWMSSVRGERRVNLARESHVETFKLKLLRLMTLG